MSRQQNYPHQFEDDYSIDQFRKNNEQLQNILMQLQTP